MTTLLADEVRTARKAHGCNACLGMIAAGDRYARQRIVDGGDAWVWKAHLLCHAAWNFGCAELELVSDEGLEPDELRGFVLRFFETIAAPACHGPVAA